MNGRQRRKLLAGAGLISMLVGALMVLAPAGAGAHHTQPAPTVSRGNLTCPAGTTEFKFDSPFDVSGDTATRSGVTISYAGSVVDGVRHYTWTSSSSVVRVIVKQGPDSAVFDYASGTLTGAAYVALMPGTNASPEGTSHLTFCLGTQTPPPPQTGSLSIDKAVTGTPPQGNPTYSFTVGCTQDGAAVELDPDESGFDLRENDPAKVISGLPVGAACTVTETGANGATSTTYQVGEGAASTTAPAVTISAGTSSVLVTNDFQSQSRTGGLSVDKVVAGTGTPAGSTEFPITVSCAGFDLTPQDNTGTSASFTLTHAQQAQSFSGIPVGTQCTVTETDSKGGTASYTVDAVPGNAATIAAGTRAVVVTNTYTQSPQPENPLPPVVQAQSLQVVKEVTGAAPDEWEVTFDVAGGDIDEELEVDNVIDSELLSDIEPGEYTITERVGDAPSSTLTSVTCVDQDGEVEVLPITGGDGGRVEVEAGDDVVCTFVNDYAEVEPNEETPQPQPKPDPQPEVKPNTQVRGAQVTRQLPRTGTESADIAGFGAGLLLLGAGLTLVSRSRRFGIAD